MNSISTVHVLPFSSTNHGHTKVLCHANCQGKTHTRRELTSSITLTTLGFSLVSSPAFAILEADEDDELFEKVKADKKKRIQKQQKDNILKGETAYVQEAVYKLSEVGQAIENSDFGRATQVLGSSLDAKWIANIKEAFTKVSTNTEQKAKADMFTTSLASLISAVSKKNLDMSKSAFVTSADALEDWSTLTGLTGQIKGL